MRWMCLAVLFCAGISCATIIPIPRKSFSRASAMHRHEEVISVIKSRCESVGGADVVADVKAAAEEVVDCMDLSNIGELSYFCSKFDAKCVEPLIEKLGGCLKPEEEYILDFLRDAVDAQAHMVCDDNSQALQNLLTDSVKECSEKMRYHPEGEACGSDLVQKFLDKASSTDYVFSKPKVCRAVNEFETCLVAVIKSECGENSDMDALINKSFESHHKLCEGITDEDA